MTFKTPSSALKPFGFSCRKAVSLLRLNTTVRSHSFYFKEVTPCIIEKTALQTHEYFLFQSSGSSYSIAPPLTQAKDGGSPMQVLLDLVQQFVCLVSACISFFFLSKCVPLVFLSHCKPLKLKEPEKGFLSFFHLILSQSKTSRSLHLANWASTF